MKGIGECPDLSGSERKQRHFVAVAFAPPSLLRECAVAREGVTSPRAVRRREGGPVTENEEV